MPSARSRSSSSPESPSRSPKTSWSCCAVVRPEAADGTRRFAEAGAGRLHGELPEARVGLGQDRFPGGEVRVGQHLGRGVDLPGRDAVLGQEIDQLGSGLVPAGPLADQLVELGRHAPPGPCGWRTAGRWPVRAAHDLGQAPERGVGVGGDEDQDAVGGLVEVGRRDVGQDAAGAAPGVFPAVGSRG